MANAREKLLRDLASGLERAEGKTVTPKSGLPRIDTAVYLMLATRGTIDVAERSLNAIESDFVDWNEVRVSSVREIGLSLRVKDAAGRRARATEIRAFLTGMFEARSCVSLEFLDDLDFEEACEALASFGGIPPGLAGQLALSIQETTDVQTSTTMLRVAKRLGIVDKRTTSKSAKKSFATLAAALGFQRFHRLLVHIGSVTCHSKTTQCLGCLAADVCPSSRAEAEAKKLAAEEAARKRKEAAAKKKAEAKARAEAKAAERAAAKAAAKERERERAAKKKAAAKKKVAAAKAREKAQRARERERARAAAKKKKAKAKKKAAASVKRAKTGKKKAAKTATRAKTDSRSAKKKTTRTRSTTKKKSVSRAKAKKKTTATRKKR